MLEAVGGFSIKSQLSCILQLAKVLHFSAQLGSACFPGYIAYFCVPLQGRLIAGQCVEQYKVFVKNYVFLFSLCKMGFYLYLRLLL